MRGYSYAARDILIDLLKFADGIVQPAVFACVAMLVHGDDEKLEDADHAVAFLCELADVLIEHLIIFYEFLHGCCDLALRGLNWLS